MWTIETTRGRIKPSAEPAGSVDEDKVNEIVQSVPRDENEKPVWNGKPVLVVEDIGGGFLVIDGIHRITAARQLKLESIPAYIVPRHDFDELVDMEFCGQLPTDLCDLDDYFLVDGAPYRQRDS